MADLGGGSTDGGGPKAGLGGEGLDPQVDGGTGVLLRKFFD